MPEKDKLIEVKKLTKDYVNDEVVTKVLFGLDFDINKGEFVAIMGTSGSGKSTLMHVLGFLDTATGGHYLFKGKDVSKFTDDELAKIRNEEVGFVFQAYNLLPRTTVLENVKLPLLYSSKFKTEKDRIARSREVIREVQLEHRINNFSSQLSGGEKQRVAIARALVNEPSIIFADEPTGNLDSRTGNQIMELFEDLYDKGNTIVLVTHEKYTAEHAQRIIQLRDGIIINDYQVGNRINAKNNHELIK